MKSLRLTVIVATVCLVPGWAAAQTKDTTIIWNTPPSATKSEASPPSSAPIRDDFARRRESTTAAKDQSTGWSDPSMPPRVKIGKPNTSVNTTGPCREFQQDVVIDGERVKVSGRACRQTDGNWVVVP